MIHKLEESMDIDSPGGSKLSLSVLQENALNLYSVTGNASGEGLPYAPDDWPTPGDKWRWKVGKRISASGHFVDRYLYLPRRLREPGKTAGFASLLSVKQYIKDKFPDADVDTFLASFSWKVPSRLAKKDNRKIVRCLKENAEDPVPDVQIAGVRCKAGNEFCSSLSAGEEPVLEVMFCDMCCSEPGFCRDCCCILCCRVIDKACGGFNCIRCEAKIAGHTCGHSCHIDCALRSYMAGTVGGSINLDAEYYCRRCDSRTDLISHIGRHLEGCDSIDSPDDIRKIFNIGICVLHGSKRTSAKQLLHHIELAMSKLKNGTHVEDIWKGADVSSDISGLTASVNGAPAIPKNFESQSGEINSAPLLDPNFDYRVESLKLEDKIDQVLDALRKSQEVEYRLAEEKLSGQKNYILNLYKQLDLERSKFSRHASFEDPESLLGAVQDRIVSIKQEISRLKGMADVAKGFGRVPKHVLKEQFGLDVDEH